MLAGQSGQRAPGLAQALTAKARAARVQLLDRFLRDLPCRQQCLQGSHQAGPLGAIQHQLARVVVVVVVLLEGIELIQAGQAEGLLTRARAQGLLEGDGLAGRYGLLEQLAEDVVGRRQPAELSAPVGQGHLHCGP